MQLKLAHQRELNAAAQRCVFPLDFLQLSLMTREARRRMSLSVESEMFN